MLPPYSDVKIVLLGFTTQFEYAEGSSPSMVVVAASST
jgi:hypothetical protein